MAAKVNEIERWFEQEMQASNITASSTGNTTLVDPRGYGGSDVDRTLVEAPNARTGNTTLVDPNMRTGNTTLVDPNMHTGNTTLVDSGMHTGQTTLMEPTETRSRWSWFGKGRKSSTNPADHMFADDHQSMPMYPSGAAASELDLLAGSGVSVSEDPSASAGNLDLLGRFGGYGLDGLEVVDLYLNNKEPRYCGGRISRRTLIILLILLAIIIGAIIVGVLIPIIGGQIAAAAFSNAGLNVTTLDVLSINGNTVQLKVIGSVANAAQFGGTLQAFDMNIGLENRNAFGVMGMPAIYVAAYGTEPLDIVVEMQITDTDAFVEFGSTVLLNETFAIRLSGSTVLSSGGLNFNNIPLDRTLELAGMNGLRNVIVSNFDLSTSTDESINFRLTASVFNPSAIALNIGPASFIMSYLSSALQRQLDVGAAVSVGDVLISRGPSTVQMAGSIVTGSADPDVVATVLEMFQVYLTGNFMAVQARVAPNGVDSPLLQAALAPWSLIAAVPGLTDVLIRDVTFLSAKFDPVSETAIEFSGTVSINIKNPLGLQATLRVDEVSIDVAMYDDRNERVLTVQVPSTPVTQWSVSGLILTIQLAFTIPVDVSSGDPGAFTRFVQDFMRTPSVNVTLEGTSDATAIVGPFGAVPLADIPLLVSTSLLGMDNLKDSVVTSVDLTQSTAEELVVLVVMQIFNPSVAVVPVGDMVVDMFFNNTRLGYIYAQDVTFFQTSNQINFRAVLDNVTDANAASMQLLFDNYLGGITSDVVGVAGPNAIANSLLASGFEGFRLSAPFPPNDVPLINALDFSTITLDAISGGPDEVYMSADTLVSVTNPLGNAPLIIETMGITSATLTDDQGNDVGTLTAPQGLVTEVATNMYQTQIDGTLIVASRKRSFGVFVQNFIQAEKVTLLIDGVASADTQLPIGSLSLSAVELQASVELNGMNGLQDVTITEFDLSTSTVEAINVVATVRVINPASVSMALGDVTFDVVFQGKKMGTLVATDVTMQPGVNDLAMTGVIAPDADALDTADILLSNYVTGVTSDVQAVAAEQASSNPIINLGLKGLELSTQVAPSTENLIASIEFKSLFLDPHPDYTADLVADAVITLNSPLGPDSLLEVTELVLSSLNLLDTSNTVIGSAVIPVDVNIYETTSESLSVVITGTATIPQTPAFPQFIQNFIASPTATVGLAGVSNVTFETPIGSTELTNFAINTQSTLRALNKIPGVVISFFDLSDSSGDTLRFNMSAVVPNPTIVSINLGILTFDIYYDDTYIGYATTTNELNIIPGLNVNKVNMLGVIVPEAASVANQLFTNYITGVLTTVVAKASTHVPASANPLINESIAGLEMSATLNGHAIDLIIGFNFFSLSMAATGPDTVATTASVEILIDSPLGDAEITATGLVSTITLLDNLGRAFGTMSPTATIQSSSNTFVRATLTGTLQVTDQSVFGTVIQQFTNNPSVTLGVIGTANVLLSVPSIGPITLSGIAVNETSSLAALNGITNVTVTSFSLASSTQSQILGSVTVQFPTNGIVTFAPGPVQFNIFYQSVNMGTFTSASNGVITPGTTTLTLTGSIAPVGDTNLVATTSLFNNYVNGIAVDVQAVVPASSSSYAYISTGLQGLTMSTSLPGSTTALVTGVTFQSLTLIPNWQSQTQVGFTAGATIAITSPLGPNGKLITNTVMLNAQTYDNSNNALLGTYAVSTPAPTTSSSSTAIVVTMPGTITLAGDGSAFSSFMVKFVNLSQLSLRLSGSATVSVTTSVGTISLTINSISVVSQLTGIGGLPTISITSVQLPANLPSLGGVSLIVGASLSNPSIATLNMGDLTFSMYYQGKYMGYAKVTPFTFAPGNNVFSANGAVVPASDAYAVTGTFFTNYLSGLTSQLTVTMTIASSVPSSTSGSVPAWLSSVCNQLAPQGQVIAPQGLQLVSAVALAPGVPLSVDLTNPNSPKLGGTVQLTFTNPFTFGINIQLVTSLTLNFYVDNTYTTAKQIGYVVLTNIPVALVSAGLQQYNVQIGLASTLTVTSQSNLATFIQLVLSQTAVTMYASGQANVRIDTATKRVSNQWVSDVTYGFGTNTIVISNVPFTAAIPLTGYNNFNGKITVGAINVLGGSGNTLQFSTTMTLGGSPSLQATLGLFFLDLRRQSNNGYLGYTQQNSGIFLPTTGATVGATGVLQNNGDVSALLSAWINSQATSVYLRGSTVATVPQTPNPYSALQTALQSVTIYATINGLNSQLPGFLVVPRIFFSSFSCSWLCLGRITIYVNAAVYNPLATTLSVTQTKMPSLQWRSSNPGANNPYPCPGMSNLGYVNQAGVSANIAAYPAYGCTSSLRVEFQGSLGNAWDFYFNSRTFYVNIPRDNPSTLWVTIGGGYSATVNFYYCGIPINVNGRCS